MSKTATHQPFWTSCLLVVTISLTLAAGPSFASEGKSIGTEGVYFLRAQGLPIEVKPASNDASLLLRISNVVRDEKNSVYEIRYIGMTEGQYDLRDFLRYNDGTDLSSVPPAKVLIVSVLRADHDGMLGAIDPPPLPWAWPYRILLALAGIMWCLPVLGWMVKRLWRKPKVIDSTPSAGPSFADHLRPLIESVLAGHSTPRDQAALERMLVSFWREKLGMENCSAQQTLARLRLHPEAGALLRQVDAWLHIPPGRSNVDVAALLDPYRVMAGVSKPRPSDTLTKVTA